VSLIVWTLIAITGIKYVTIAMRIDNDGEGGILALMALLGVKRQTRPAIVALGLFGAALIYGDGAITPAISVLSALEGLTIAAPALGPYVVSMAVAILVVLFAIQSQGTARIAHCLRPGDGGLVRCDCLVGGMGHHQASCGAARARSALRDFLSRP
jgi:KUP system potassium uptake protein